MLHVEYIKGKQASCDMQHLASDFPYPDKWKEARGVLAIFFVLLLPWISLAENSADAPSEEAEKEEVLPAETEISTQEQTVMPYRGKPQLNARLRLEYEYREQGSSDDSDAYGRFYTSGRNYWSGKADFYVSMRLHSDLDNSSSDGSLDDDLYYSVDDADGVTEDRLLQAYADLHSRNKQLALRGGRQYVEIADYMQMDGAQLILRENSPIGGRIYGGHPVSYYTTVSGDYAGGMSVIGKPWEGNQSRFTFANYHDDSEDDTDHNYYVDLRQKWTETLRSRGQVSVLNEDFRMARADMYYLSEEGETDFNLGGSYWGSFDAKTRAYSPLYEVLGEQDPYSYGYARLTQQILPHWLISPGVSLRFADTNGENDQNNRDYSNFDVTLIYEPTRAFNASISLEYWEVEDSDSFSGISGELRYRNGRIWEVSGGASYSEYTYDTYSDFSYTSSGGQTQFSESGTVIEESPFVKTYFIRGKWRIIKSLTLRAQFDIEDDDIADDLAYRGRGSIEVRY